MKRLVLILSLLVFTTLLNINLFAQDCTQDQKAQLAKNNMSSANDGLMCANAAQFYAYLCECENKPRTAEQAKMLKATLEKIKQTYNDYGMYCKGIGRINENVPNCLVGTSGNEKSSDNVSFSNTLLFGNQEISQLEQMAQQSGDEDFIYLVNDMKRIRKTNEIINMLGRDENAVLRENSMQIVNLFISPFNRKLEEEANKTAAFERRLNQLERDITNKEVYLKKSIFQDYILRRRTLYLMSLYGDNQKPEENLIELYKSFPINEYYEHVAELIALKRTQTRVMGGFDKFRGGIMQENMGMLFGDNYEDLLFTVQSSKFAETLENILGDCNVLKKSDFILQLKHSDISNKNELILKELGMPRWNEIDYERSYNYNYRTVHRKNHYRNHYNPFHCQEPKAFISAIFAVDEDYLDRLENLIKRELKSPQEVYADLSPNNDLLEGINNSELRKLYRRKQFNLRMLQDSWNTMIKMSLYKRKNNNDNVIEEYIAYNNRIKTILGVELGDITVSTISKLFRKEIDYYYGKKIIPYEVLKFIEASIEVSLNAVQAYLEKGDKETAKKILDQTYMTIQILTEEYNLGRIAMVAIKNIESYSNVHKGKFFDPESGDKLVSAPIPQSIITPALRYYYYIDYFNNFENIDGRNATFNVFVLEVLDRNNFSIEKYKPLYMKND